MTIQEADELIKKYVELRDKHKQSKSLNLIKKLQKQETICLQKFNYLVLMKTARYKNFHNYDDLNQEGLEALLKAMKSYHPERGSWFWWAHKYIGTRISRSANTHTAIKFPLKYAKETTPFREPALPMLVDKLPLAADMIERKETIKMVKANFVHLNSGQKKIIKMLYGISGEEPKSVSKICQQLKVSRENCLNTIEQAFSILRENVKL